MSGASGGDTVFAILDWCMPDMDGVALATQIADDVVLRSTRTMLLSSAGPVDRVTVDAAGLVACINKPVRLSELHDSLVLLADDGATTAPGPEAPSPSIPPPVAVRGHPDSLELLTFLAERLHDEPVLVVASFHRLELGQHDGVVHALAAIARRSTSRRLTLAGLDRAGTIGLLAPAIEEVLSEHLAGVIHDRSEGNPFFASELARLLIERPDALEHGEVPAGVRDVVRQRLSRLPEPTRQLLPLTAVLGRDIEPMVLAAAAGLELEGCLERLDPALVTHLLVPGALGELRFTHALVREVLVDDLSSLRRARLHLSAADALAALPGGDEERAEVVAEHLWEAVPVGVGQRAAEALERAGDVASRRTANESAERSYARAAELRRAAGDDVGELGDLLRLGATQRFARGFGGAAGTFARARELAHSSGRIDLLVELLWAEWADASSACDYVRSRPLADDLGEAGRSSDDPALQAAGLAALGIQRLHEGVASRMPAPCWTRR